MKRIFREVLALQWKTSRWGLAPFILLGFGLPLLALRLSGSVAQGSGATWGPSELVLALQIWNPIFPLLALLLGVAVALTAWSWDHKGDHIYALSLPVARWEYVLTKLAAGALLLLLPVLALWAGAVLGIRATPIPEGLNAYPHAFTARFLLASLLAYATTFALAAGTMRTTVALLLGGLGFLVFGSILVGWLELSLGIEAPLSPVEMLGAALMHWPGPFHVFGGNWTLIDV